MKYIYQFLVFFLIPFLSIAQSNYKPGYVITSKGDTLRGFINYQNWDSNPTAIAFKSAQGDRNRQTFTVNDISLFTVTGFVTFKKFVGSVSLDETNTTHLVTGKDTSSKIEAVFLRILQA
ncbi:MAG: hypothetical protein M3N14_12380, partial [Bacteroidota bacterium]|nr:hypothetical protein [Bacteroidota bacterium]